MPDVAGLIQTLTNLTVQDSYKITKKNMVRIYCPNRIGKDDDLSKAFIIKGIWLSDLGLDVTPEWANASGTFQTLKADIDKISTFTTMVLNANINQPWFAREFFKNTPPLQFKLTFRLFTDEDSGSVFQDVNRLVSLAYPRIYEDEEGIAKTITDISAGALSFFYSPGPSPLFPVVSTGDYLQIFIGDFFFWDACYIKNISGTISPIVNTDGLPMYADVTITFRTMDSLFVDSSSNFNFFSKGYIYDTLLGKLKKAAEVLITSLTPKDNGSTTKVGAWKVYSPSGVSIESKLPQDVLNKLTGTRIPSTVPF